MFCTPSIPSFPAHTSRYAILSTATGTKAGVRPSRAVEDTQRQGWNKKLRRHQVRIHPLVMIRPTLHVLDFTPTEVQRTWYGRDEIRDMKNEGKKIAGMDDRGRKAPPHDGINQTSLAPSRASNHRDGSGSLPAKKTAPGTCLRGLEGKTTLGLNRRRQVKLNARKAVLEEQQRQWEMGILDAEAIAEAYFECAKEAQISAHVLGLRDEREVWSLVETKSRNGGITGNSWLQISMPRWHSFEKHMHLQ